MARKLKLSEWNGKFSKGGDEGYWIYNGLDSVSTVHIVENLFPLLDEYERMTYDFSMALRGPIFEMMLRGVRIDQVKRQELLVEYSKDRNKYQEYLDFICKSLWGQTLNPNSPKQMYAFFYDFLQLPVQYKFVKGEKKVDTGIEALTNLKDKYPHVEPIVNLIVALRDCTKIISVLVQGIDSDSRFRCSINITGTENYRMSSSQNIHGTGSNSQNLTKRIRQMFIADEGYKLAYVDLNGAEARDVAYEVQDENMIEGVESGDIHTKATKLIWDSLPWTGDAKEDKALAESQYIQGKSLRDLSKRCGHGSNYMGKPATLAKHTKISKDVAQEFQTKYFAKFPGIRMWHLAVKKKLVEDGYILSSLGEKRTFFGRRGDDATLREAIAFSPQSTVGRLLNLAIYRVWWESHWGRLKGLHVLLNIHDAILFQYPEEKEAEYLAIVRELMTIPLTIHGKKMIIPVTAEVGWNWMPFDKKHPEDNPKGLKEYKG